jgi:hypothetical protein
MDKEAFYAKATIPGDVYNNVPEAQTIAVVSIVVCRDDLSEDLMYQFVKGIFDNLAPIHNAHAVAGKLVTLETALDGMPLPLHPGAEKFFKEKGMR